jgi:tRNA G10  N-methylase Trm11
MKNNTKQLGFILGRDVSLSVAEVFAYLQRQGIKTVSRQLIGSVLLFEIAETDMPKIFIDGLGGAIKFFEVIGSYESATEVVEKLLTEVPYQSEKRVNFGVSGYGNVNKSFVLKVGYDIKNSLQESGYAARFVTGKTVDLSSVIVNENKLIERGFEAIIAKSGNLHIIGKTISVQDYKAYSKRDFGRPKRDGRNGMLPPKLAQMMINFAAAPLTTTIYDPFCGSGTILQEALFLGYRDIYGSDIERKNIEDTLVNMEWLYQRFGMPKIDEERVFKSDILEPAKSLTVGAIVGEGYLGEPVRRRRNAALADSQKLAQFYVTALVQMKKQLANNGTIVLAIPFFIVEKEYFYLSIMEELEGLGLETIDYIPNDLEVRRFGRGNLTYSREDQFVGRELLILKKTS